MTDDRNAHVAAPSPSIELGSVIVTYENRPAECTIYQSCGGDGDRMSAWVTATEGSFVDLRDVR